MRFEDFTPRERVVLQAAIGELAGGSDPGTMPWAHEAETLYHEIKGQIREAEVAAGEQLNKEGEEYEKLLAEQQ